MNYDLFSKYFDELMVNPIEKSQRIESYIKLYSPNSKSVLDIACGTGSILNNLPDNLDKNGIDISAKMLSIAKKKVKKGKFYHENMLSFNLDRKFDVILCNYDSINHLLNFEEWEKFFHNVKQHLNENGVFIFDINTKFRLKRLSESAPQVYWFGKKKQNCCLISVSQIKRNLFIWSVKIFEHQDGKKYQLLEENIAESSFAINHILKALRKEFIAIFVESDEKTKQTKSSERIWFTCILKK